MVISWILISASESVVFSKSDATQNFADFTHFPTVSGDTFSRVASSHVDFFPSIFLVYKCQINLFEVGNSILSEKASTFLSGSSHYKRYRL